ncbi:hypothetical protein CHUAL_010349 [Chamberlinius hualienensis]
MPGEGKTLNQSSTQWYNDVKLASSDLDDYECGVGSIQIASNGNNNHVNNSIATSSSSSTAADQSTFNSLNSNTLCPSCNMPFDKGKKRKLIDACGHERCYSCMFTSDQCPLCRMTKNSNTKLSKKGNETHVRQNSDSGLQLLTHLRPKLKTNGHFTPFMQARQQENAVKRDRESSPMPYDCQRDDLVLRSVPSNRPPPSPRVLHLPWSQRKHRPTSPLVAQQQSPLSVIQSWPAEMFRKIRSLWSLDDEGKGDLPPPPAESARHDLFVRLGLLLGDREQNQTPIRRTSGRHIFLSNKSKHTSGSLSSLTSSDANTSASTNSTSPLSTLTASSEADHLMSQSSGFRSSRDQSSESMASLTSSSTGTNGTASMTSGSGSPVNTLPRRHSLTATVPDQVDDLTSLYNKRKMIETRTRPQPLQPVVIVNGYADSHIDLKPLFFEVPHQHGKSSMFIGRQWILREIEEALCPSRQNSRGVIISGGIGSGKTSVILQLVENSCFGRRKDEPVYCEIYEGRYPLSLNMSGSRASLCNSRWSLSPNCDRSRSLGSTVVAYHFCQADNNVTCLVPEFVHNMAAQMCQAPQLSAYRDLLLREPQYQAVLCKRACIVDPHTALLKGILEPLIMLKAAGKINSQLCVMVVDSLNEAEFHRPDYGDTIASFLSRHIYQFPGWLKVIVSVRTLFQEITKWLPFHRCSLDGISENENLQNDLFDYISHRINHSEKLRANVTFNGKLVESCNTARFTNHLMQLSKGCFLYAKLTLDLIEQGHLVMKSVSYKVLPINLSEVFLLLLNLRFRTTQSFQKAAVIMNTTLASLYPMSLLEIYHSVNAGYMGGYIDWDDFNQRMALLSDLLIARQDNTYMFFHPSFREWLVHRSESETGKFLCDPRAGHANIAFRLTRLESPLSPEKTAQLGHHILKAHIYKTVSRQMGFFSRDVQALWVCLSSKDVSASLTTERNAYSPNVKVSRLLMLAGSDPNSVTEFLNEAPVLGLSAHEGFVDMVTMLLEFNADPNCVSKTGMSPLCFAASRGHLDIIKLLLNKGATLHHTDVEGRCALAHASLNGHLQSVMFLLQCDWSVGLIAGLSRTTAAQQALIVAASKGHTVVCEYLLGVPGVEINGVDSISKQTALTSAAVNGHKDSCLFFLRRGASVIATDGNFTPPLHCSVRDGHVDIAMLLLDNGAEVDEADGKGCTALMLSASGGYTKIIELLLAKGASMTKTDNKGLTALCWACIKGEAKAVQILLDHGSNLHHTDGTGLTPLNMAAFQGDPNTVQLLLDRGAMVEHVDHSGMRPLDRAIGCKNTAAVICFLKRGAKLGPSTWTMAADKPDIMLIILSKLLEDGNVLYKKNRLKDAAYRFQYALKKFPTDGVMTETRPFQQLKVNLLLSLSRCWRKSNALEDAVDLATKALEVNPRSYEAFYARAKARRGLKQLKLAAEDLAEAVQIVPENKELRRLLIQIQEEIKDNTDSPCSVAIGPFPRPFDNTV